MIQIHQIRFCPRQISPGLARSVRCRKGWAPGGVRTHLEPGSNGNGPNKSNIAFISQPSLDLCGHCCQHMFVTTGTRPNTSTALDDAKPDCARNDIFEMASHSSQWQSEVMTPPRMRSVSFFEQGTNLFHETRMTRDLFLDIRSL
jgi:hypothetical protein